jgi:hypothetical protein
MVLPLRIAYTLLVDIGTQTSFSPSETCPRAALGLLLPRQNLALGSQLPMLNKLVSNFEPKLITDHRLYYLIYCKMQILAPEAQI